MKHIYQIIILRCNYYIVIAMNRLKEIPLLLITKQSRVFSLTRKNSGSRNSQHNHRRPPLC